MPYKTEQQQRLGATYLPPTASWIHFAGNRIYNLCKKYYDRLDVRAGSTLIGSVWLWRKGRGYSSGRWAFWIRRLNEKSITQILNKRLREMAVKAASGMIEIENS